MADSINNKAKEYYDNDDTGGSLNNNLKDFLKQQGAEGNSLNTLWRNYAYGEGGNSLNTRLGKLWGTSGSLIKRWKDVLGLTWDELKLFFNARRNDPELLLSGATSFDGSDDYINTGTAFSNTNHTISAWVNASATGGVVFDNRDANDDGIRFLYDSNLTYQLNSSDITVSNPSLNTWHHIACTYDGTTQKLYLNGSLVASASTSQTVSVSQNLVFGKQSYSDVAYFNGSLANVGIWNRALSLSEIESIYWKGQYADLKGTELTNLVSWYNLKDTGYGSAVASVPEGGNGSFAYSNGTWTFASNVTYAYDNSFTQGLRYRLTYTIATYTSGSINVSFSNGTDQGTERSAVGTYTEENEISSNANWYFNPDNFVGTITDVTLEEVIAPDSTATNNGSIYGATTLTDAYSASSPFLPRIQDKASDTIANYGEVYGGNAVSFDGASDYISVADSSDLELGTSDFSFSFWMNLDDVSGTQTIFNRRKDGSNSHWIQVKNTGYLDFGTSHGGSSVIRSQINSAIVSANKWYHIVWSVDRDSTTNIYIDGLKQTLDVNTKDDGANTLDYGVTALIGGFNHSSPSSLFDGSMSGFKYFKGTALTQDQVRQLYIKPELTLSTGIASSALKLDMPMQEGSGTAILDGSGNQNHGTGSGITWATGQEYGFQHPLVRSNNPMVFDGVNDHINLNGFKFSGNQASFSFWAKFDSLNAPDKVLMDLNPNRSIVYYTASTGLNIYSNNATVGFGTLNINTWYHIVGIFDGTTARMYVNGSQFGTDQTIVALDISSATACKIGSNYVPSGGYVAGMINEVAVWDSVLTANEITALYNSGLPLLTTTDSGNYASSDDLVGYWRNDGVTTWLDRSTNSNNGTVSGSPASIIVPEGLNEGRDSQGYYLTDTDSISSGIRLKGAEYISVQDSESLSFGNGTSDSPFSLEAWVKPNDVTNFEVFAKGVYNSTGEYVFGFEPDDKLKFYLFDESVASTTEGVLYNTALTSSEGQWMHIVGTYDGRGGTSANAGMKIYLNGSQVNNGTESAGTYVAMENLSANLEIGKYSSNYAKGSIDEAKVYSKALSATEVLKNYNNGKSAH